MPERSFFPLEVPATGDDLRGDYPVIEVPQEARQAAANALRDGQTHYVPVPGIPSLRDAVAHFLGSLGVDVPGEQVIITGGMQEARFLALQGVTPLDTTSMLAARGDRQARFLAVHDAVYDTIHIAVPEVADPGVRLALKVRKRHVTTMPTDEELGLLPSPDAIRSALAQGSNLIYLESPSRLTGAAYTSKQVGQIADILEEHDAKCVWDQSTAPAVPADYKSLFSIAPDRTLAIGMLWPGMGLSLWQIGYIATPPDLAEAVVALKQVLSICTATPAQWGAFGTAPVFAERHAALLEEMTTARAKALSSIDDKRIVPGHAVNIIAINLGRAAAASIGRLGDRVDVTDGNAFGAPGIVRLTVKPGSETAEALSLLSEKE